jgi:ATP-dependent DNA ligase
MLYAFSLPTKADKVPAGPNWLHEIKYDGYRMMVLREGDRVRLISRGGHDWAKRFPLIVEAVLKLRRKHFVIDGEVVVLDKYGVSDFDALASRQHDKRAQFYAFDMLANNGEDLRGLPLALRKSKLTRLFSARSMASSSPSTSKATSATIYSAQRATWALKGSSRSTAIAPIAPASASTGLRSRTPRIRRTTGSGMRC